jgi:crossover junction endodeoxyribonuclease RuvC
LSGAIATLDGFDRVHVSDMPTLTLSKGGKAKRRIDCVALARVVQALQGEEIGYPAVIVIEQPMALPGQSAPATFDTGRSFGIVEGMAAMLGARVEIVTPSVWKKRLAVPAAKDGAIARASQLLPWAADQWPLKKHDGRAEAALLALYGRGLIAGTFQAR